MNYEDRKYLYLFESMSVWSSLDSEDVILYFSCRLMFDRRSRNFVFNDTSSSNSKTILSKYFLLLLFGVSTFTFYLSNFFESVLLLLLE